MNYVKTLGLAVVVASALLAFVGGGVASATVFCSGAGTGSPTGTTCPSGQAYGAGTKLKAKLVAGTKYEIETKFGTIKCEESTMEAEISEEVDEPLSGPEGAFTLTNCPACEVSILRVGFIGTEWISGTHNGTETFSLGETTVRCTSIFGIVHCIYQTELTDVGTITGGNPAQMHVHAELPRLTTGALCAERGSVSAEYEITAPKPLYVAGHT